MNHKIKPHKLPKLKHMCQSPAALEQDRNELLYSVEYYDATSLRRKKMPLHKCLCHELFSQGYLESSRYLADLVYDNIKFLEEDDLGIIVDIRKRPDYLHILKEKLQQAETLRQKGDSKSECLVLLFLAKHFTEREKGVFWLAENLFLAAIAVASQYYLDGGRVKAICKYHLASFLLNKYGNTMDEESMNILIDVRDESVGKTWLLYEPDPSEKSDHSIENTETVFTASSLLLHAVLMKQVHSVRRIHVAKAEQLARLAERRAIDAGDQTKCANAIQEIGMCQLFMNSLNSAKKSYQRALAIYHQVNHTKGICETNMQLAAVMQRLDDHQVAINLLTEAGNLALQHNLRKHLGRALHFLGELYLWQDEPALGTVYLSEAFSCFHGFEVNTVTSKRNTWTDIIYKNEPKQKPENEIHIDEAEQSRLMTAVSAGQEVIFSFFNLMKEAENCTIARLKIIEWKLNRSEWWMEKDSHLDEFACSCSKHNRTPLDLIRSRSDKSRLRINYLSK